MRLEEVPKAPALYFVKFPRPNTKRKSGIYGKFSHSQNVQNQIIRKVPPDIRIQFHSEI